MKAKKILFLFAGLLKVLVSALFILIGLLILLLGSLVKSMFKQSYELVESFLNELVTADASYSYVLEYTQDQAVDFVMGFVNIFTLVMLIWGFIWLTFAIINFVLSKRGESPSKGKSIALTIFTWLLTFINISNILTTIALFLKEKRPKNQSNINTEEEIPSYQI